MAVLNRDHWICRHCGRGVRAKGQAHVDHVISREERPDLALSFANLETLCASCHSKKTIRYNGGYGKKPSGEESLWAECDQGGDPLHADHPWNVK